MAFNSTGVPAVSGIEISVIIPAFNAAKTIIRAIDSVRAQECDALEILIIDDGSSDNTIEVVRSVAREGEQIRIFQMEKNQGVSAARNVGIRNAKGTYIAFLDADDIWLPGKLKNQIEMIKSDSSITLVSCNSQLLSPTGEFLKEGHVNRPPVQGVDAWKTLLTYNFLPTPTVFTYTELVREIGGFDESLKVGEDLDLWIKLGLRGKIAVLPKIYTCYYDTPGSLMKRNVDQTKQIVIPMLQRHLMEQRARLSTGEVNRIKGQQAFTLGCVMFFSGIFIPSITVFLKSAYYGCHPIKSLLYVARALVAEPFRRMKFIAEW